MTKELKENSTLYDRFINSMTKLGDKLPYVFVLFLWLFGIVAVITTVLGWFNLSMTNPVSNEVVEVKSFFSAEGLGWFFSSFFDNVMDFPPFGIVLLFTIAIGVCEVSGLFPVLIKRLLVNVPTTFLTVAVVFLGMIFSLAGDASIVIIPALAGLIFYTAGKNPIVGILAGYGAAGGGFGANLIVTSYDALLYPLTNKAIATVDPSIQVSMVSNWYFFAASCIILTITGTFVTIKFVEPKFGKIPCDALTEKLENAPLTDIEKKGLRNVLIATIIFISTVLIALVPQNGWLRGENGALINSPFMSGLSFILFAFFIVIGAVFGITTKVYKDINDISASMAEAVVSLKGFIISTIVIAQLTALFNWSNLGTVTALSFYKLINVIGLNGGALLIVLVIITMIASIVLSSASALWSIFAPMFVPTFMLLGFDPAVVQAAFRIGSPILSIVSPFMIYIPMVLTYIAKYTKKFNVGQLISAMIPYSVAFFIVWVFQLIIWVMFDIPLGPDGFIYL